MWHQSDVYMHYKVFTPAIVKVSAVSQSRLYIATVTDDQKHVELHVCLSGHKVQSKWSFIFIDVFNNSCHFLFCFCHLFIQFLLQTYLNQIWYFFRGLSTQLPGHAVFVVLFRVFSKTFIFNHEGIIRSKSSLITTLRCLMRNNFVRLQNIVSTSSFYSLIKGFTQ